MLIIKTVPEIEKIGIVDAVAFMAYDLFTQGDITLKTIACEAENIFT